MVAVFYDPSPEAINHGWRMPPAWPELIQQRMAPCVWLRELDQYRLCEADAKIAIYVVDWAKPTTLQEKISEIEELSRASDWVFVIETEPHSNYLIHEQLANVTWLLPGVIRRLQHRSHTWQYHLWRIADLYSYLAADLDRLRPYDVKPLAFDALLGTPQRHREFVWDAVTGSDLDKHVLITMSGRTTGFLLDPDMELVRSGSSSHTQFVRYRGMVIHAACLMPLTVYNQTAYTVLAETDFENDAFVLSEKLAKPLLAKRLFVAFASCGYLQHVRDMGFQTFGAVIDESYDLIEDHDTRWQAALAQVHKLCTMDQASVLRNIQAVTEHNHAHLIRNNFVSSVVTHITDRINSVRRNTTKHMSNPITEAISSC